MARGGTSSEYGGGTGHAGHEDGVQDVLRLEKEHVGESLGGEQAAKEAGKMRAEGKAYTVADGDVLHFLHSG